jgi:hypothetical protein
MSDQKQTCCGQHSPLVLIWLGILTGALIATMLFAYQLIDSQNYQARILKNPTPLQQDINEGEKAWQMKFKYFYH